MTTYGPSGSEQPDDPYQRPATGPDGSPPIDPTRPQWGPPPAGAEPPTAPMWGQPPASGPGYPPPAGPGWAPPPSSGAGYPPPSSGAGYPPPPGPFPPAGPTPGQPAAPWGQPAPGGYGMPPAAPAKKTGGKVALIIALVVLLLLCPCLGLAGWAVWKAADADSNASPAPSASARAVPPALPSDAPTPAAPSPSEVEFAKGDCVVNEGTEDDAELRKVACGPNTYQVLLRIPATSDGDRCETLAPQATANYVHDNSVDLFDYVLCLKKR
ncbi:hypothetical protein OG470_07020 [Micromonospora sp. NBC_00389]